MSDTKDKDEGFASAWWGHVGDFGAGDVNFPDPYKKSVECECGQKGVSYAKHSDYCPMQLLEEK
jgi:hypothetical protein